MLNEIFVPNFNFVLLLYNWTCFQAKGDGVQSITRNRLFLCRFLDLGQIKHFGNHYQAKRKIINDCLQPHQPCDRSTSRSCTYFRPLWRSFVRSRYSRSALSTLFARQIIIVFGFGFDCRFDDVLLFRSVESFAHISSTCPTIFWPFAGRLFLVLFRFRRDSSDSQSSRVIPVIKIDLFTCILFFLLLLLLLFLLFPFKLLARVWNRSEGFGQGTNKPEMGRTTFHLCVDSRFWSIVGAPNINASQPIHKIHENGKDTW